MCHLQFRNLFLFSPAILGFCISLVCFQPQLVCFDSARTVHVQCTHSARPQCTATVHGLETLQIPQKMAPRLQNKEKTGFRIFYLISCHFNRWRAIYTICCACTVACTVRALYVHCQNTRARPAPPSCSSIGCWNTLMGLGAVLCLLLLFVSWWARVPAVGTPLWALVFCRCLRLGELVCPRLEHPCEPWCFAGWIRLMLMLQKSLCSISRYLQTFRGYCWWKKSCTGAGIFDNTVWLLPPHPLFNVVFSSIARWCRISVIQLLCFCDKYFLPMLNGEHEGQGSKCVWWCRIFSINRLQKSCRLVFWLSCSVAWNACRMCMYACLHVWMDGCMYVCTHVLFEM